MQAAPAVRKGQGWEGGSGWGWGAGSCWQVDSICIWHTDCTKYANRQTMPFAVLFLLWYCSLSAKSTKEVACMLLHLRVRVRRLCTCQVHRFFNRPHWVTPMRHRNHMKGSPSVRIALSKESFDVWKWRWVSLKERPYRWRCHGRGELQHAEQLSGVFLTPLSMTRRHGGLMTT